MNFRYEFCPDYWARILFIDPVKPRHHAEYEDSEGFHMVPVQFLDKNQNGDRIEEAALALERLRAIKPDFDLNYVVSIYQQVRAVGLELYIEGLKKAGLQD